MNNWKNKLIEKLQALITGISLLVDNISNRIDSLNNNKVDKTTSITTSPDLEGGGTLEGNIELGLSSDVKGKIEKYINKVEYNPTSGVTTIALKDGSTFDIEPVIYAPVSTEDIFDI